MSTYRTQPHESMNTVPSRAQQPQQQPSSQQTVPSPAITQANMPYNKTRIHDRIRANPPVSQAPKQQRQRAGKKRANGKTLLVVIGLGIMAFFGMIALSVFIGVSVIYGNGILPNVSVAGVSVSGLSESEAIDTLASQWTLITLRDGQRTWNVERDSLGINLDAQETAERAYQQGRGAGNPLSIILSGADISPVVTVDPNTLTSALENLSSRINIPAQNAGVAFENGQVQATAPINGRLIDISATISNFQQNGEQALANGELELMMLDVQPTVTDSSALVSAASQLLTSALDIGAYDPMTGDIIGWTVQPQTWATWLSAESDPNSATGLSLSIADAPLREYLLNQSGVFDASRYLDIDEAIDQIRLAVANNDLTPMLRVYHNDRQHTVGVGETITSIAWDYGVPYPWLQQANPGVSGLSVGQTITIPSVDNFLPYDVVPEKRIVVSISQQRVWVYENGAIIQDWAASTGIRDSPTWTGVYQIISHVPNAYAGNWDLWMPNFMGVYQPIPNADFTNGFHGFPTRGGGQLLWENSLGTRVTYGCILLSNQNVSWLYDWAETGVVVEIQG